MTRYSLIADESGAKGYSGSPEQFPGQSGVFAGVIVPESHFEMLFEVVRKLEGDFGNGRKFHITDLTAGNQELLRERIVQTIIKLDLTCVYEAIYVSGFTSWFEKEKQIIAKQPKTTSSGIKISGNIAKQSLHDHLFQGLVGKAIAWCEGRHNSDYHLTVHLDNVDKPILKSFIARANELLGGFATKEEVTGFDPKTKQVVKGEISISVEIPQSLRLDSTITNVTIDPSGNGEALSIFPDVLSNWLNYVFNERNKTNLGINLNARSTLNDFPLQGQVFGFSDDSAIKPLSETLFRYCVAGR